jgi:hypothetical protein
VASTASGVFKRMDSPKSLILQSDDDMMLLGLVKSGGLLFFETSRLVDFMRFGSWRWLLE